MRNFIIYFFGSCFFFLYFPEDLKDKSTEFFFKFNFVIALLLVGIETLLRDAKNKIEDFDILRKRREQQNAENL